MKRSFLLVATIAILFACQQKNEAKSSSNDDNSLIAAGGQSEKELAESMKEFSKAEEKRLAEEKANQTSYEFDKLIHDFGDVKADTDNACRFKITNTGKKPLIIQKVEASCGCTTPRKPEHPIAPGQSDYMEVNFHPNSGQLNEIIKTVTVTSNTPEGTAEVKIRAFVKP